MILDVKNPSSLTRALAELRSDGVVAIPTETVYGLAADIGRPRAIEKIFTTKNRPEFDPLIVHISDFDSLPLVAREISPLAENLAQNFWPGPLTMVLPRQANLNPMITSGLDTVAVRMPANEFTRALIRELGSPVAAPSANRFGHTSPTTAAHVEAEFNSGDLSIGLLVLDDGPCRVGIESTVITFAKDQACNQKLLVLRPGAITAEELSRFAPTEIIKQSPQSPGHLRHHYMPSIPLVILHSQSTLTSEVYQNMQLELKQKYLHPSWMTLPEDPLLAARLLYANMRAASLEKDVNCIFLIYPLEERRTNLWAGISDRLEKAATLIV